MMKLINWVLKYRSIPLNLLFAAYLLYIQPVILLRLNQTVGYTKTDYLVGWSLLILQIVELAGAALKLPVSTYYYRFYFSKKLMTNPTLGSASVGCLLFPWIFHMLLAIFLGFIATDVLIVEKEVRGWVNVGMVFALIFKETVFIALNNPMIGTGDPAELQVKNSPLSLARMSRGLFKVPSHITLGLALRDLLGDLMLLAYAAIGFTVLWDANPFFTGSAWGLDLFALIYFLIVYVSLRGVYFMQDVFLEGNRWQKIGSFLSFLLVLAVSMFTLPWR